MLEQRQMLAATLQAGQFTIVDSDQSAPDHQDIVLLTAESTAGVNVDVNTTDSATPGNDRIDSIVINDPDPAGVNELNILLVLSGPLQGPVIYAGSPGDHLSLTVITEGVNDAPLNDYGDALTGALSGVSYGAAAFVADSNGSPRPPTDGDRLTAAAGAYQGGVEIVDTVSGGTILLRNYAGDIGSVLFRDGVDLGAAQGSSDLTVTTIADAGLAGTVRVLGRTSLSGKNMILTLQGLGLGGNAVVSEGSTIDLSGAGGLTIRSASGAALGNVTLGSLNISGSGDVEIHSSDNADIAGAITIAAVSVSGGDGGSFRLSPAGTGDIRGKLSIGTVGGINLSGSSSDNHISIGGLDTSFQSNVTLGPIAISTTEVGADFTLLADTILGTLSIGDVDAVDPGGLNAGDITVSAMAAGDIRIGNITLGDAGANSDSADFALTIIGAAASLQVGDITNRCGDVGDAAFFLGEVGDVTVGTVRAQNPGFSNLGGVFFDIQGDAGHIATGGVTMGDVGDAEDVASFELVVEGTASSVSSGNLVNANLNSDIAFFLDGAVAQLTLGSVAITNPGVATEGHIVVAAARIGEAKVGRVTVGDANADDDSGVFSFEVAGAVNTLRVGEIANHSVNDLGDVVFDIGGSVGRATVDTITVDNPGHVNSGDVTLHIGGNASGVVQIGNVSVADAGEADTGAFSLSIAGRSPGGVAVKHLTTKGTDPGGGISINLAGDTGKVIVGNVTAANRGAVNAGSIGVSLGARASQVRVGTVTLGDWGDADTADFRVIGAGSASIGQLNVGRIATSGTGGASLIAAAGSTGSIGGVSLGDISISDGGANAVQIGQAAGATAMARIASVLLRNLINTSSNPAASLVIQARDIGSVNILGKWTLGNAGGVSITADAGPGGVRDGFIDTIRGDRWDLAFASGASGRIAVSAADGIGPVIIHSMIAPGGGFGNLEFNHNADGDEIGVMGDIIVRVPGSILSGERLFSGQSITAQLLVEQLAAVNDRRVTPRP